MPNIRLAKYAKCFDDSSEDMERLWEGSADAAHALRLSVSVSEVEALSEQETPWCMRWWRQHGAFDWGRNRGRVVASGGGGGQSSAGDVDRLRTLQDSLMQFIMPSTCELRIQF